MNELPCLVDSFLFCAAHQLLSLLRAVCVQEANKAWGRRQAAINTRLAASQQTTSSYTSSRPPGMDWSLWAGSGTSYAGVGEVGSKVDRRLFLLGMMVVRK